MGKNVGIFETLRAGIESEEEVALNFMFPSKSQFRRLQMMTHHQMRAMVPLSVLGLFRRMYRSNVLKIFQEELGYNKIALDRLGRVEGSEIVAARRAVKEREEEE
jgi:hypothetical protein